MDVDILGNIGIEKRFSRREPLWGVSNELTVMQNYTPSKSQNKLPTKIKVFIANIITITLTTIEKNVYNALFKNFIEAHLPL